MSIFQWPFKRKQYPGLGNPRFVSDIVAANEAVIDAMIALTGLGPTDFAIIAGLAFTPGSPGNYGAGIFYLNGSFYYTGGFQENLYLIAGSIDTESQPFSDANARNIYTLLQGLTSSSPVSGSSPQFTGNMNAYRISNSYINSSLLTLQTLYGNLKAAAFANIGTTTGTVAAGDDPRFGYTKAQADSLFALKNSVLLFGNTNTYTPTLPYEPATKKYADESQGSSLLWVGNIDATAAVVTKLGPSASTIIVTATRVSTGVYNVSHNIGNTNYYVLGIGLDNFSNISPRTYYNKTSTGFTYHASDDASLNDGASQLSIFQIY